jgi:hypothetical protein
MPRKKTAFNIDHFVLKKWLHLLGNHRRETEKWRTLNKKNSYIQYNKVGKDTHPRQVLVEGQGRMEKALSPWWKCQE